MFFYDSKSTSPYENLAMEDYVFSRLARDRDYFLLWQNDRTVVVGKFQNTLAEVNQEFVDAQQIRVARRLSGGGAVYHDLGNLNYTFIVDADRAEAFEFRAFTRPLVETLRDLGVEAESSGRNDVTIQSRKISGSSQYIRNGRLLHHGCIMLDTDLSMLGKVLHVSRDKIESKGTKSVRSRVTTINDCLRTPVTMDRFKALFLQHAAAAGDLEDLVLTPEDFATIARLRKEKYETWEWNYGRSPECNCRRYQRFPFGGVTAEMRIQKGIIEQIRFYGDFFGAGELSELEAMLTGLPLTAGALASLRETDLSHYIAGMTWDQMVRLLCY